MDSLTQVRIDPWLAAAQPTLRTHLLHFAKADVGLGHLGLDVLRRRLQARLRAREETSPVSEWLELLALARLHREAGIETEPAVQQIVHRLRTGTPLLVSNDAIDLSELVAAWFLRPVWALATRTLEPPLQLTFGGRESAALPALVDRRGMVADLVRGVKRGRPRTGRQGLLIVLLDFGIPLPLAVDDLRQRIKNWFESLTGGELVAATTEGGVSLSS